VIQQGLDEIESKTCVKFVYKTDQLDFIQIFSADGCFSNIGRVGGMQNMSLQRNFTYYKDDELVVGGCMTPQTVMHEFIHAVGYTHMHVHSARDDFVKINMNYVQEHARNNFNRISSIDYMNFDTPYDYESIMHYEKNAFAIDDQDTIVPVDLKYLNVIGKAMHLSDGDVKRINRINDCQKEFIGKEVKVDQQERKKEKIKEMLNFFTETQSPAITEATDSIPSDLSLNTTVGYTFEPSNLISTTIEPIRSSSSNSESPSSSVSLSIEYSNSTTTTQRSSTLKYIVLTPVSKTKKTTKISTTRKYSTKKSTARNLTISSCTSTIDDKNVKLPKRIDNSTLINKVWLL
jgi:Astacin (Peptidase family M12A)